MGHNRRISLCAGSTWIILLFAICAIILYSSYAFSNWKFLYFNDNKQNSDTNKYNFEAQTSTEEKCQEICFNEQCLDLSNHIMESMDERIDPCDDFYTFVCGEHALYLTENSLQISFGHTHDTLKYKIKELLQNIEAPESSLSGRMKIAYDSCLNESSSEAIAVSTLTDYLQNFGMEGWPHLDEDFRFLNPTLHQIIAMMESYNPSLLKFRPHSYIRNSTSENFRSTLKIIQGSVEEIKNFEDNASKILRYLGLNGTQSQSLLVDFNDTISSIKDILKDLNATTGMDIDCANDTIDEEMRPACDILQHFVQYNGLEGNYSSDTATIVGLEYFQKLFMLFSDMNHRTLANFFALGFILENRRYLNAYFEKSQDDTIKENSWKNCVKWITRYMNRILRPEYLKRELFGESLNEIRQIVNTYASTAAYYIWDQTWIEENRRKTIADKAQRIINIMDDRIQGIFNMSDIETWYDDFHPSKTSFPRNALEMQKLFRKNEFMYPKLRDIINDDPFDVNAGWDYSGIELFYGIILPPIFDYGRPKLINLVSLGDIIGHEMGHQIQSFFWDLSAVDNYTLENYRVKKWCVLDQYSEFEVRGVGKKVKTRVTFDENEADLIGVQLSEKILEMYRQKVGAEAEFALPFLNYTPEQLVYLLQTQFYCTKDLPQNAVLNYETDPHTDLENRVRGNALNSKDFSQAFHCPEGSKMNPPMNKKCAFFE